MFMHEVTVYSRKNCHLCDAVKEMLASLQSEADFQWTEVDIDSDPELRAKFDVEVPMVFIDGKKAFKYRVERTQFLKVLAGRSR